MPLVEIKDFNNKPFFDQPVKNKQKAYEILIETPKNNYYYTTDYLLYFSYHQNYYKLIGINL